MPLQRVCHVWEVHIFTDTVSFVKGDLQLTDSREGKMALMS